MIVRKIIFSLCIFLGCISCQSDQTTQDMNVTSSSEEFFRISELETIVENYLETVNLKYDQKIVVGISFKNLSGKQTIKLGCSPFVMKSENVQGYKMLNDNLVLILSDSPSIPELNKYIDTKLLEIGQVEGYPYEDTLAPMDIFDPYIRLYEIEQDSLILVKEEG